MSVGRVEEVTEDRLELVVPRSRRSAVIAALRSAHSYEEPAFDVVPVATAEPGARAPGLGRIGRLGEAITLGQFCSVVADALPRTAAGVRAAGDPDRVVRRVAVCGGSGGGLAGAAAAGGADVLVTADGRHHSVLDSVLETGLALVDVAHWASEWPWLADAARVPGKWACRGRNGGHNRRVDHGHRSLAGAPGLMSGPSLAAPAGRCLPRPQADVAQRQHANWSGRRQSGCRPVEWLRGDTVGEASAVKAAPESQLALLNLQALDTALDRLAARRRSLPELDEIAGLTAALERAGSEIVVARTEAEDLGREQHRLEREVDPVRTRADRDRARLDAGQVSSPRELENLQSEIESLGRRQTSWRTS